MPPQQGGFQQQGGMQMPGMPPQPGFGGAYQAGGSLQSPMAAGSWPPLIGNRSPRRTTWGGEGMFGDDRPAAAGRILASSSFEAVSAVDTDKSMSGFRDGSASMIRSADQRQMSRQYKSAMLSGGVTPQPMLQSSPGSIVPDRVDRILRRIETNPSRSMMGGGMGMGGMGGMGSMPGGLQSGLSGGVGGSSSMRGGMGGGMGAIDNSFARLGGSQQSRPGMPPQPGMPQPGLPQPGMPPQGMGMQQPGMPPQQSGMQGGFQQQGWMHPTGPPRPGMPSQPGVLPQPGMPPQQGGFQTPQGGGGGFQTPQGGGGFQTLQRF